MGFLDGIFRPKPIDPQPSGSEHAVIVHLRLSDATFGTPAERTACHDLEHLLESLVANSGVGELDGDEFGGGECTIFLYGRDADALFAAIEGQLRASPLSRGGRALKRYGAASDPNAKEVQVSL